MHFCTDCGNMYYIRLTDTNGIVYYCRNCGHENDTITIDSVVVSHTSLKSENTQYAHVVNKYTKMDPTLPRISTILCPNMECPCNRNHNPTQYADRAAILGTSEEEAISGSGSAPATVGAVAAVATVGTVGAGSNADDAVPREVIYLRYDDINMKYIYLCAVCNTIWKTEHI
jgi:DNA-directed RNA polymerase subunit M/transcription elongation factor TFIIS